MRQTPDKGYLTIKGISAGATRQEYEYEIPLDDARELLDNFSISELSKIRYIINFDNKIWEVIGTSVETAYSGEKISVRIIFDNEGKIKESKVLSVDKTTKKP